MFEHTSSASSDLPVTPKSNILVQICEAKKDFYVGKPNSKRSNNTSSVNKSLISPSRSERVHVLYFKYPILESIMNMCFVIFVIAYLCKNPPEGSVNSNAVIRLVNLSLILFWFCSNRNQSIFICNIMLSKNVYE